MAGLLSRLKLIEPTEDPELKPFVPEDCENENIQMTVENLTSSNVVNDIYAMLGESTNGDIFAAERFLNTLPENLPKDKKQTSVIAIIAAAGMNLEEILKDGNARIEALNGGKTKVNEMTNAKLNEANTIIEKLQAEFEEQKNNIYNLTSNQNQMNEDIDKELEHIQQLIDFLKGE